MLEEIIKKILKNVKNEKILFTKLMDDTKYSDEDKEILREKYKNRFQTTITLIERLLETLDDNASKMELFRLIDKCSSELFNQYEDKLLTINLVGLIKEQLSIHKYLNLNSNNFNSMELLGKTRCIDGEFNLILYKLAKELLDETKDKKTRKKIADQMTNRLLSEHAIKYHLAGDNQLAEKFYNTNLYFNEDTVVYFLAQFSQPKIESYISLIENSMKIAALNPSMCLSESYFLLNKFSSLYLTSYLIQCRMHGYIPNIDTENLNENVKFLVQSSIEEANRFCQKYNFNNESNYRKVK